MTMTQLQVAEVLPTDKNFRLFPRLEREGDGVTGQAKVQAVLNDPVFEAFRNINILPLSFISHRRSLRAEC